MNRHKKDKLIKELDEAIHEHHEEEEEKKHQSPEAEPEEVKAEIPVSTNVEEEK